MLIVIVGGGLGIHYLRQTSTLFNMIFTPPDWSVPLATTSIDFGKNGQIYLLNFQNKYPGLHWFEVRVAKPSTYFSEGYKGDFELLLEIKSEGKIIESKTIKGPGGPFSGEKEGFAMFWYRVPNTLPLRKPLEAKITVLKADNEFFARYGTTELAIRKLSDI